MRIVFALVTALLVPACISSSAISAVSTLSSLPDDRGKREERLDSEMQRPNPEEQAKKSPRALKIETAAATTAAFLGILFSKHQNVTLGVGIPLDENRIVVPGETQADSKPTTDEADSKPTTDEAAEHTTAACLLLFRSHPETCTEPSQ